MSEPVMPSELPDELTVQPVRHVFGHVVRHGRRRLVIGGVGITAHSPHRTVTIAYTSVRLVRSSPIGAGRVGMQVLSADSDVHSWTLRDDDWSQVKALLARVAPDMPIDPPPPRPRRIAADAALRAGDDPAESLRSVRRAMVGRWWVQVRPWAPGFRAEAHTISGPASVWAGELRATLAEATDDAIAMIEELRHEG